MHTSKDASVVNGGNAARLRARYSMVAVGGSAGGLQAVIAVLGELPADFCAPILVVLHLHPNYTSHAAEILSRRTKLKVKNAVEGDELQARTVYVAPPDRHLLVEHGVVALVSTPAVNYSRPAIDRTFDSVVQAYGSRVIGVVLSGTGRDGSEGLRTIKEAGGYSIVEDPVTAAYGAMPNAAVSASIVDSIVPLKNVGPLLVKLTRLREDSQVNE